MEYFLMALIGIALIAIGILGIRKYSALKKEMMKKKRWELAEHCTGKIMRRLGVVILGVVFLMAAFRVSLI